MRRPGYAYTTSPICDGDVLALYAWRRNGHRESLAFHNGLAAPELWTGNHLELAAAMLGAAAQWGAGFYFCEVDTLAEALNCGGRFMAGLAIGHALSPETVARFTGDVIPHIETVVVISAEPPARPERPRRAGN